ncbi:hypothetical protein COV20_05870 [Candidatus Woesearchaeota archaeon CG10_big_fil_rev_8_21_14_0_10_45_16]|nr:MAG: hypothetical protein COV20_05870 [Candidatus Woesearchaeota archaeon CG10_big_fil_rev_8_21_14_0_10_45_16]
MRKILLLIVIILLGFYLFSDPVPDHYQIIKQTGISSQGSSTGAWFTATVTYELQDGAIISASASSFNGNVSGERTCEHQYVDDCWNTCDGEKACGLFPMETYEELIEKAGFHLPYVCGGETCFRGRRLVSLKEGDESWEVMVLK